MLRYILPEFDRICVSLSFNALLSEYCNNEIIGGRYRKDGWDWTSVIQVCCFFHCNTVAQKEINSSKILSIIQTTLFNLFLPHHRHSFTVDQIGRYWSQSAQHINVAVFHWELKIIKFT